MDQVEHVQAIERDGRRFIEACAAASPDAVIAACSGWRTPDLLWHLTEVHAFWCAVVAERATDPAEVAALARPLDDAELPGLYRRGLEALVQVLADVDPATPVWTWSSQRDAAFVIRRMALETAMHTWDAERAAGAASPIDAALASDGIDEFLHLVAVRPSEGARLDGSVHLHCTDVAGEWTTRLVDAALVTAREHAKGDCALRGTADVLYRALWRRADLTDVDVIGDAEVARQFIAWPVLS